MSQALECLREHCHPSMLDNPDALVWAKLEFNMANVKKDKYIDSFTKMIPIYNPYERGVADKQILVFCKKPEEIQIAEAAGAKKAGGSDLVQDILKGKADVTDYDHFLATEEMALELKPLLGILRDRDATNKIVVDDQSIIFFNYTLFENLNKRNRQDIKFSTGNSLMYSRHHFKGISFPKRISGTSRMTLKNLSRLLLTACWLMSRNQEKHSDMRRILHMQALILQLGG